MEIDLFEHPEKLPLEVYYICDKWAELGELDYEDCDVFLKEVEAFGYTFDYYLTAEPYNLRPIKEAEQS